MTRTFACTIDTRASHPEQRCPPRWKPFVPYFIIFLIIFCTKIDNLLSLARYLAISAPDINKFSSKINNKKVMVEQSSGKLGTIKSKKLHGFRDIAANIILLINILTQGKQFEAAGNP